MNIIGIPPGNSFSGLVTNNKNSSRGWRRGLVAKSTAAQEDPGSVPSSFIGQLIMQP